MKRYNKINTRWVILGIICPILAFLFSMNVTYAFFTATANNSNAVNKTGLIKITFDPLSKQLNTTSINDTATVYPGDTLNINGKLVNNGNNDCYAVLEFEVYVQKYGASTKETAVHKYYAYEGNTLKEITGMTGSYSTYASIISSTSGSNKKSFNLSYEFTGAKYDNSYKKATVTYAVNGYAIQTANISQTKATEELLDTAGYKYLTVYGNSVQNGTPSPANPVEIQSVGERTDNLFNINDLALTSAASVSGNTLTLADGSVNYATQTVTFAVTENTTYKIYALIETNNDSGHIAIDCLDNAGALTKSNIVIYNLSHSNTCTWLPFTTPANTVALKINIRNRNSSGYKMSNIMITPNSSATEYEPYGYKIPVSVKSKNLFDYTDINNKFSAASIYSTGYKCSGLTNIRFYTNYVLQDYIGETVTISFDVTASESGDYLVYQYQNSGIGLLGIGTKTVTLTANVTKRVSVTGVVGALQYQDSVYSKGEIIIYRSGFAGTYTATNIQFEIGETATSYEPYVTPSTTYVYLDEPLRKVGDYADYIDLQTGTLVRQVGSYVITGYESWTKFSDSNNYYTDALIDAKYEENITCLTNFYAGKVSGGGLAYGNGNAWFQSVSTYKRFYLANDTYSTLIDFKAYLQNQYSSGNPVRVLYVLASESSTTISVPDLGQFDGSVIEVGTTVQPSETISSNKTNGVSDAYQQVEYIGLTGTQYIDTGFKANQDTSVDMYASSSYTSNQAFFCSRSGMNNNTFSCLLVNGYVRHDYNKAEKATTFAATTTDIYHIYANKNKLYINNTLYSTITSATFAASNNLYLGASNGNGIANYLKGNIYSCSIWDNGTLVRDFVPCYRKTDNVIGLYDKVNDVFYENAGTGTFTKGADI